MPGTLRRGDPPSDDGHRLPRLALERRRRAGLNEEETVAFGRTAENGDFREAR